MACARAGLRLTRGHEQDRAILDGEAGTDRLLVARLNLRAMRKGDTVLFYHSVEGKEVVGIAKVVATAYPDATATEGDWSCVDLAPVRGLKRPVTLGEIKASPKLREIQLVKQSRLSVLPLTVDEYEEIVRLSERAAD